jgi:hypothetical protein
MAIKIISKPVKGIIAVMITSIGLGLLSLLIWSSWSGFVALLASLGGMIAFLGLWMEKEADDEDKKEHLSNFIGDKWVIKLKSEIGWWILLVGIFIEIATAGGFAAYDAWETRQIKINVEKNSAINLPIKSMTARISLTVLGTNVVWDVNADSEGAKLAGRLDILDKKGSVIAVLGCKEFDDTTKLVWPTN